MVYAPTSFMMPGDRDAYLIAREQHDGDKTLRVLDDADSSFFGQMSAIVGGAVSSPPPLLRSKVEGEVKAVARQSKQAVPTGSVPASSLPLPQNALLPSRNPVAPGSRPGSLKSKSSVHKPVAVAETVDAMPAKKLGPSSVPRKRRRPMWDPKPSELPFGVNRNSTFEMLFQARRANS